jgi:hypothetical protein
VSNFLSQLWDVFSENVNFQEALIENETFLSKSLKKKVGNKINSQSDLDEMIRYLALEKCWK